MCLLEFENTIFFSLFIFHKYLFFCSVNINMFFLISNMVIEENFQVYVVKCAKISKMYKLKLRVHR